MKRKSKILGFMIMIIASLGYICTDYIVIQSNEKAIEYTKQAENFFREALTVIDTTIKYQKYAEALDKLNKALECDSNYFPAYYLKINIFEEMRNYNKAFMITKQLELKKGKYPELLTIQGMLLEKLNKSKESKEKFNVALLLYTKKIEKSKTPLFNDKINVIYLQLFLNGKEVALEKLDKLKDLFPDRLDDIEYHRVVIENFNWNKYFHNSL